MTGAASKRKGLYTKSPPNADDPVIYTPEEIRSRRGRASRRKGAEFERVVAKIFASLGWYAKKVPGSGGISGFKGDVQAARSEGDWNEGRKWVIECKCWQAGMKTIRRYLPQGGILIHKADYEKELVIMSAETFAEIVKREGK